MKNLQFKIQGEYITQTADELLQNGDMKKAITVLHGSTLSGEITEKEHRLLVYDILDGRARIVGTYPTDDYDVIYPEDKKNSSNIADILAKITKENTKLKEQLEAQQERMVYILEYMKENHNLTLQEMCDDYQNDFDELLFEGYEPTREEDNFMSKMLDSYIERMKMDTDDDYGWLEPNGTYHPVEWGLHNNWAEQYLLDHYTDEELKELYYNEEQIRIPATDVMIYKLNWILLHNPSQGLAEHTAKPGYPISKAAKDFLYNYYTKRKQYNKAKLIYESED